ncbi:DM13 domain-containing protein [Fibrella sp. WM1]|uniref:DM13 domain-containing protein n=1 Tax=Fibrella musci TaxID=3242485 RepID=UPI00351FE972
MKALFLYCLLLATTLLTACQSPETPPFSPTGTSPVVSTTTVSMPVGMSTTTGTDEPALLRGTFVSNVHPTSGTVSLREQDGKRTLVFSNFRTDGGPDLRIYLAENTSLRNFIEVSKLSSTTGAFSVELPPGADPARQRYVLIWCKAFSVLFGNAELK